MYGEYCHNCGQKISGRRLNLYEEARDFVSNVLSIEKSVFGTTYQTLKSPSKVIKNYFKGNRRYYSSPFKLAIFASLFIGLHIAHNENLIFGLGFTDDPKIIFILLFLIIFTLSSYFIYHRKGYSFLEISIVNIYVFSALILIFIPFFELIKFAGKNNELISFSFIIGLLGLLSLYNSITLSKSQKTLILLSYIIVHLIFFFMIIAAIVFIGVLCGDLEVSLN